MHCVIIGFTNAINANNIVRKIFDGDEVRAVKEINPYLINGPFIIVAARTKPLCDVPRMVYGSMPIDDGAFTLEEEDVEKILSENPKCKCYIRDYAGGAELLKNKKHWCLWLIDADPNEIKKSPSIVKRIERVKAFREKSGRPQTKQAAQFPMLFDEIRQPNSDMLVFPKVSSEKRRYIPISFVKSSTIISGSALMIADADNYMFGVLSSNVHNAWMRVVAGRMKSDYQYSASNVYNTFPWPNPTESQKKAIELTAQGILDARAKYPNSSLATLYDPLTMPPELRKAHTLNDIAVMHAYGFSTNMTESDCVAELMKMYQSLVASSHT